MSAIAVVRAPLHSPAFGALAALVVLVVANAALVPRFFAADALWAVALQVAPTVLVASGMTLVVAGGGIDLSVGSVMAIASAVAAMLLPHGVPIALGVALFVALAVGAVSGFLVAGLGVLPFIATLGILIVGRGAAQLVVSGSTLVTFSSPSFEALGKGRIGFVPVPVIITTACVLALAFALRRTTFGRWVVAIGGNERAARMAGVPIGGVKLATYVISGLLAGVAGVVVAARLGATDPGTTGAGSELDAIAATVVGGTTLSGGRASIVGTVIGGLLMGVLTATFAMHLVPYAWGLVAKAVILVVAVYLQRSGAS